MKRGGESENRVLSFIHLYDDKFAHLPKYSSDERDWIIFPQDFIPDTKRKYSCTIVWTMFGYFKYNGKDYKVARAYPIDLGSFIDEIDYKYDEHE